MLKLLNKAQFTRAFSTYNQIRLVKLNPNCEEDKEFFANLTATNIAFSALRHFVPNMEKEVDINNIPAVQEYFMQADKRKYLFDAYRYVSKNNNICEFGYNKVINEHGKAIGVTGFMPHVIDKNGIVKQIERGNHFTPETRSNDTPSNSPVIRPRYAAIGMKKALEQLFENRHKLDLDGELMSNILADNIRSQNFTLKHKLNIGEPKIENGIAKWREKIGNFLNRKTDICEALNSTIRKGEIAK